MTTDTYTVELSGEGVSIKRPVSKEIGEQIAVLMLTGATAIPSQSTPNPKLRSAQASTAVSSHAPPSAGADLSIREALDASGAKRAPDKITVIGDYIKKTAGTDFGRDDIIAMFEAAAEKVPANLARDLKWTQKAAWIAARNGEKGRYYVTHTGMQAIKAKFAPEFVKKTKGFTSGAGKKSSKSDGDA